MTLDVEFGHCHDDTASINEFDVSGRKKIVSVAKDANELIRVSLFLGTNEKLYESGYCDDIQRSYSDQEFM